MKYAIATRAKKDRRWLGAEDLARILPVNRTKELSCYVSKKDRVLFTDKDLVHEICRQMCDSPSFKKSYVVVKACSC